MKRRRKVLRKLLVANRGEIALRVIRACRAEGIWTVWAHSGLDAGSIPATLADETVALSPPGSPEGYLDAEKIVATARKTGCDAVHPGYGFLSESAGFAEACRKGGLIFVGPSPETLRATGDKLGARRTARRAGVPTIPGSDGTVSSLEEASALAGRIGFPVVLKAACGGGGKGIRIVERERDLPSAWELARAEALRAFGSDIVYLEKRIHPARHLEVQILAGPGGKIVHLGERECSIQRRHQKLIEESPSPACAPALRARLAAAAVAMARACGYRGAGTVEFLLDGKGRFYFLEVNARVQVEHPVSEAVTGVDIVRAQLAIAAARALPFRQADIRPAGHAIEARILAEDPFADFRPATGVVRYLRIPGGPHIRFDTALAEGTVVTPHYDSLLAKAIAWGRTRREAAERLAGALDEFELAGLATTAPFLADLLRDDAFGAGSLRTDFLEGWSPPPPPPDLAAVAAVAAATAETIPPPAAVGGQRLGKDDPWVLAARREAIGNLHGNDRPHLG